MADIAHTAAVGLVARRRGNAAALGGRVDGAGRRLAGGIRRRQVRARAVAAVGASGTGPAEGAVAGTSVDAGGSSTRSAGLAVATDRCGGASGVAAAGTAGFAGQSAEGHARRRARGAGGRGHRGDADTALALGTARRVTPADHRRGCVPRWAGRDPGRGQPDGGGSGRCAARDAGGRHVRRRRWQDAGAGHDDAEPRADRRVRRVGGTAGRRGTAAAARRRAQRRASSAGAGRQMGEAAGGNVSIACWSMRPARAPEPGGAIPMRACG